MSERQGVEIDYCPTCRGVWLDRGELDKIVERADSWSPPRTPDRERGSSDRERGERDRDDRYDRHDAPRKKKRSFLSELFED